MNFDAPIPGQSLTGAPGNAVWEHPPKFTDLSQAADWVFNQICQPNNLTMTMSFMRKGVPIEMLANMICFAGFHSGKWNPDLAMMLKVPVMLMLIGIAKRAGINDTPVRYTKNKLQDKLVNLESIDFNKMQQQKLPTPAPRDPMTIPTKGPKIPGSGFMMRG